MGSPNGGSFDSTLVDLPTLAIADGATFGYKFNENSGNLIDFVSGAINLNVDAVVTRQIAAACPLDKLAYQFTGAAGGGAPAFGHCQNTGRPTLAGATAVTYEAIVKSTNPGANQGWIGADRIGVVSMFGLGTDGAGDVAGYIIGAGGQTLKIVANGAGIPAGYNHYIWLNNGTRMKTYLNGTLVNDVASAISTPDGANPTDRSMQIAGSFNTAGSTLCFVDYFAAYYNVALTQAQITAHFNASGCPL